MAELETGLGAGTEDDKAKVGVDISTIDPTAKSADRTPDQIVSDDLDEVDTDLRNALSAGKKLHAIASGHAYKGNELTDEETAALGVLSAHAYPKQFEELITGYGRSLAALGSESDTPEARAYHGPMRRAIAYAVRALEAK